MRRRRLASAIEQVDAFPKIADDYVEASPTRGTLSIVVFAMIGILVLLEIKYYLREEIKYSYEVDVDHHSQLKLNIDVTVAMPCQSIGADVMDSTSRDTLSDQQIDMDETWFEMSPRQAQTFDYITSIYKNIRSDFHALHSSLWLAHSSLPDSLGPREIEPDRPKDACRVHGTFRLNKVAGNLHIIAGKSVSFFGSHAHMVNMMSNSQANFSHRIDKLSFGDDSKAIHNSLNFELKTTNSSTTSFLYFVSVVPSEFNGEPNDIYQYSVTERVREINHDHDSHGTPGIFFKYDITPLKVKVAIRHKSLLELFVLLVGIVGGIFATTSMLNSLFQAAFDSFKKA